ncbi:unnamed protein product [Dibothriocephalus latus]|uniref:Uncharacterized protein n=1 Tax=Dibothriocephalus latus TaxID=60516 RepID=A0A3P6VDI2_DIBLA|nr:unnamed protein product [Dibothriocephalus latus]
MFNAVKETTEKLKVGRFYTEFGICEPDGNPASINTIECNAVMNGADANLQSWTYWDSQFFDGEGNPYPTVVRSVLFRNTEHILLANQNVHYNADFILLIYGSLCVVVFFQW